MSLKELNGFHLIMRKSLLDFEKELIRLSALLFWTSGRGEPNCFMMELNNFVKRVMQRSPPG